MLDGNAYIVWADKETLPFLGKGSLNKVNGVVQEYFGKISHSTVCASCNPLTKRVSVSASFPYHTYAEGCCLELRKMGFDANYR